MTISIEENVFQTKGKTINKICFVFNNNINEEDFKMFKEKYLYHLTNQKLFCICFDLIGVSNIDCSLIFDLVKFLSEVENMTKEKLIASTILIKNNFIQLILNKLFLLKKPSCPNYICSEYNDGIEFLKDCSFVDKRISTLNN